MKRAIAVLLAFVSAIFCFAALTGCTPEARLQAKQNMCSHKWREVRRIEGTCKNLYDTIVYDCSKCGKEKKEKVSAPAKHNCIVTWISHGEDCRYQDQEMGRCGICDSVVVVNVLETYGPHVDNGLGRCKHCGINIEN